MQHRIMKQILSAILSLVILIGLMPTTAMTRTITPVETDGGMHLRTDASGTLLWNPVAGATGYTIEIYKHPGNSILTTDSVGADASSYPLYAEMDDLEYDHGDYRIELRVSGANAEYTHSSLIIYYNSPYDKLSSPANPRWSDNTAQWDAVVNATHYNVYVRDTATGSLSVRYKVKETYVDLSDLSPKDGWYFTVVAFADGYRFSEGSESPRKNSGSRTIIPVTEGGAMNLRLLANGTLLWDKFADATSYTVDICQHPGNHVYKSIQVNKSDQFYALIETMDAELYDNGTYRIEVSANSSSAEHPYQSILIYYDSPYKQLSAPANLHWNGFFASWDAVPHAQYYNVHVSDPISGSIRVKSHVTDTFVALTDLSPQPGWFFEVIAYGTGYRHSTISESPRKGFIIGTDSYNASTDEFYSGGQIKLETESGISDYSYIGESFEVPHDSEVALTALPDEGYEFVEWRIGSETGKRYSTANSIGFRASESLYLVAVFHKSFPPGTGTISNPVVCTSYEELKYALEHPTIQGIVVNSFDNSPYQTFYTLEKEKDFQAGCCAITVPANTTKYLTIHADINIRVPYVDYLLYSFIDNRGSLTIDGTGSLNVSMNARGYPSAIIYNNGALNIGGNVTFDPTNQSFDSMHGYSVVNAGGFAVINSGTFIGYATNAVAYHRGHMDIYGGTFQVKNGNDQAFGLNTDSYLSIYEHDVNLYGGTFDGIRAEQSIGTDIVKLPDLLGYGAYYTHASDATEFDPSGKLDTHEKLTVLMNNIVRDVELTFDPPKQNGTPDQTVNCSDYAYKQATGNANMWDDVNVYWEESTDGKTWTQMASKDTFTVGYHYRAAVNVIVQKGNLFDIDAQIEPNVAATVNGCYAEVFRYPEVDPSELICVRFDFGILNDNVIEQIDIDGVTEPVVGEHPSYDCAISGTGYTINTAYNNGTYVVNGICWYDVTYDMWLRPKDTFQIGHQYKVFVDVKTESGYEFYTTGSSYKPAGWGYINGQYATLGVQSWAKTEQSLSWTFTCQPKTIKSVAVSGLDVPVDGATPDFDAITNSDYYTVESIEWTDYTAGTDMTDTDTFVAGNEYWVLITLVPRVEDGNKLCKFVANNKTVATLNGIEVKKIPGNSWQEVISSTKRVQIYYTFKKAASQGNHIVTGQVTSYKDNAADITLQLIPQGATEAAYQTTVRGNTANYSFANVAPGSYTLKVMKENHVTREYPLVVTDGSVTQDAKICLIGDVTADGKVNMKDWSALYDHVNEIATLTGYNLACADVNTDGKQNMKDWSRLYEHVNEIKPLF